MRVGWVGFSGWVGMAAVVLTACAGGPVLIPVQPIEAYAFRQTQAGIRVAVDPFFTADRTRATFSGGEEFPERGLLPIQVIVENESGAEVRLTPRESRLVRPDGAAELPLSPYDAFALVKVPVGWWALGAGFLGASAPGYRNETRLRDIQSRALQETTLSAGQAVTGFLYFAISEQAQNLAGSRVLLSVRHATGRDLFYEIPVEGRRDIPAPSRRTEPAPREPSRTEGTGGQGVIIRSPAP